MKKKEIKGKSKKGEGIRELGTNEFAWVSKGVNWHSMYYHQKEVKGIFWCVYEFPPYHRLECVEMS